MFEHPYRIDDSRALAVEESRKRLACVVFGGDVNAHRCHERATSCVARQMSLAGLIEVFGKNAQMGGELLEVGRAVGHGWANASATAESGGRVISIDWP